MRLLAVLLLAGLTAPVLADEAKTPEPKPVKLGLRVVRVMPESHQALLYDKNRGTHVLVEVGKAIEGFTVQDIDDDEVTLAADGASIVLAAPDQGWRKHGPARADREVPGIATPTKPADPYAPPPVTTNSPAPAEVAPVDPYGDVRTVEAPKAIDTTEPRVVSATGAPVTPAPAATPPAAAPIAATPITTAAAPPATAPAAPAPITTAGLQIDPAVAVVIPPTAEPAAPDAAPQPSELAIALVRADVAAALTDFGKLSTSAKGAFTPAGLRLDKLADGSLYVKAGLRPGDIVTAVDGKPLHSIDDAADLYARAGGLKAVTVLLVRGGKPLTLRVAIQ